MQWEFCYRWLYGAIEPLSGERFLLEFSHLDAECFEVFLEVFSQNYRDELNLIQVDNAMAHIAHSLRVPDNVVLVFQPPYCPEVNPIERLWQELKRELQWCHFASIEALQAAISQWVHQLSAETVRSLTKWGWLIDALCIAGI